MKPRNVAIALGLAGVVALAAWAQAPPGGGPGGGASQVTARVETAPLELYPPERYRTPSTLAASRQVTVVAPADGIVRETPAEIGESVRERQELVRLDRSEAIAHLKIAEAEAKEAQAQAEAAKADKAPGVAAAASARVEAAQARVDLAKIALERSTLSAPFAGRVLAVPVSPGQFVVKGTKLVELADETDLRALVPVDRREFKEGQTIDLNVEGGTVSGKVLALLPLPDSYAYLRELSKPWSGAWVGIENRAGKLEPGQWVRGPSIPDEPVTVIPSRALRGARGQGEGTVQVLRNEFVTDVPVTIVGEAGPNRTQVSGPFRPYDLAIVESSTPLSAGTFLRFTTPYQGQGSGAVAEVTPGAAPTTASAPVGGTTSAAAPTTTRPTNRRIAPIGAPRSNAGTVAAPPVAAPPAAPAASKPARPAPTTKGSVPF